MTRTDFVTLPYIKLYTKDILANAAKDMDFDAFGIYVILLCYAWTSAPPATIPADDMAIRKAAGIIDGGQWERVKSQVLAKFEPWQGDKSRLVNARLLKEWQGAQEGHEKRSKRGKAGAAKRWHGKDTLPADGGFGIEDSND